MSQLGWRHHTLIQALLSRGPLREDEFYALFFGITGKNPAKSQAVFQNTLLQINKELSYVQFELRGCRDQYDGKVYYGVINNVPDEQSKLGTKYSVPQIALYKAVIDAISQDASGQGCINNIDALNLRLESQVQATESLQESQSQVPYAFRSFSMSQKEKTLNDMIQERWLCSTSPGTIGLGVRSFLDLRSWFRSNSYPSCEVCNEPAVRAVMCANEGCTVRIHSYCLRKKFSQRNAARICPSCSTAWPPPDFDVGEDEQPPHVSQASEVPAANTTSRKRPRTCKAEAMEAAQAQSQDNTTRKRSLRSCKAEAVDTSEAGGGPSLSSQPSSAVRKTCRRSLRNG